MSLMEPFLILYYPVLPYTKTHCFDCCIKSWSGQDATLNAAAGKYAGLERFKARKALWADMEAEGLVIKKDNYTMR